MQNTGKRIIGFMAAMLLAFGLIPGGVLGSVRTAKADGGNLWFCSKKCIEEGVVIQPNPYDGVVVSLSGGIPTIKLNGAALTPGTTGYGIRAESFSNNLHIELEGNNSIAGSSNVGLCLIECDKGITFSGSGNLLIDVGRYDSGIKTSGGLSFTGTGTITMNATNNSTTRVIYTDGGDVNIRGNKLVIDGNGEAYYGITTPNLIKISDGAEVEIKNIYGTSISSSNIIISGSSSLTINGGRRGINTYYNSINITEESRVSITNANFGIVQASVLNINGANVSIDCIDTAIGQDTRAVYLSNKATLVATGSKYGIELSDDEVAIYDSNLKAKATGEGGKAISGPINSNKDGAGWETSEASGKPEKIEAGESDASELEKYKYIEIPYPWEPEPTPAPEKTPEPEAPKSEPEKPASSAKDDDDEERDLNLPKTGDAAENGIWIAMILTGVAVMAGLAITRKRTGRKTGRE